MTSSTLRTIVIAFAVAIAVAIGAYFVGSNGKTTPVASPAPAAVTTTPTPKAEPTPRPQPAPVSESLSDNPDLTEGESVFVLDIEAYDGIDYTAAEEAPIAAAGSQVCYDLSNGVDAIDIAFDIADTVGLSDEEAGFVVGLAAGDICPEFVDEVMESANNAMSGEYVY